MLAEERRSRILDLLAQKSAVTFAELFRAYGFSRTEVERFHLPGQASPRLVAFAFK